MINDIPHCDFMCAHPDTIGRISSLMPEDDSLIDLAELFKMFGDSTRISILYVLFDRELCVGDIAAALGMGQSAISHQLRLLKTAGLVRSRRDGKTVYYALDDGHVHDIFKLGYEHVNEKEVSGND